MMNSLFIGSVGMPEVLLIVLVVLLLFGGKKGIHSFKEGMNGVEKEITSEEKKE